MNKMIVVAEASNLGRNHGIFSTYTKDCYELSRIAEHGERPDEAPIAFAEVVRDGGLPYLPEVQRAYIQAYDDAARREAAWRVEEECE